MFAPALKKVFDKAVKDAIEQIPAVSIIFSKNEINIKETYRK